MGHRAFAGGFAGDGEAVAPSFSPWEVNAQGPGSVAAEFIVLIYGGWSEGLSWVAPPHADSALLTPGWGRLSSITKNASFSCKTSPCRSLK